MAYPPQPGYPPGQQGQQGQMQQGYAQQPAAPSGGGSAAQEAMQHIDLLPNETVAYSLQADGFFLGTAPILKMIAWWQMVMTTITGGYIKIFLIVTNQRLLVVNAQQMCCGCTKMLGVNTIALGAISEVGTAKETQMCCFNSRAVHVESLTQRYSMVVKHVDDNALRQFISNLSQVIVANKSVN